MKLNIQNVKTLNTKELLRVHSRLKYDQLARVASCTFGATCTMNKNALSSAICAEWRAQVLICKVKSYVWPKAQEAKRQRFYVSQWGKQKWLQSKEKQLLESLW